MKEHEQQMQASQREKRQLQRDLDSEAVKRQAVELECEKLKAKLKETEGKEKAQKASKKQTVVLKRNPSHHTSMVP